MSSPVSRVYLDHNATSPLRPEAARALACALDGTAANPSSVHAEGRAARAILETARDKVAALARTPAREVVFTSGGSEAISAAVRGVCERAPSGRRRIVLSALEHSAVLEAAREMRRSGFLVEEVPGEREGRVDPDRFASMLGADAALAALQWANNETGVVQPIEEIGGACAVAGVPLLVDAVQAAGKVALDPRGAGCDLLALSAHKIGGPQGTGALIVREGVPMAPLISGGAQERRRRGGTEAVAAIAGFGAAAEAASFGLDEESSRLLRLRERIEARLEALFPDVRIHGKGAARLPNTVNFAVPGVSGELLVIAFDVAGFAVSTGSACASGAIEPSHVIRAMGYDDEDAKAAVRVSLGWSTTEGDVERFLSALPGVIERVRSAEVGSLP